MLRKFSLVFFCYYPFLLKSADFDSPTHGNESISKHSFLFEGKKSASFPMLLKELNLTNAYQNLGNGRTGSVDLYTHKDGTQYAVKKLKKYKTLSEKQFLKANIEKNGEISRGEALATKIQNHPHILTTHGLILYHEDQKYYRTVFNDFKSIEEGSEIVAGTITEIVSGARELFDIILERQMGFDMDEIRSLGRQLAQALAHLHSQGICHRDIKPENILYNSMTKEIQLIDFGFLRNLKDTPDGRTKTSCGTSEYAAPEIIRGQSYNSKIDSWSFGVTLFVTRFVELPFNGIRSGNSYDIMREIVNFEKSKEKFSDKKIKIRFEKTCPDEFSDLLDQLITSEENRITIAQALEHPFFKEKK